MAINRFSTPVQSEYISLYVPIPFEQLYAIGKEYNDRLDKAYEQIGAHILKYKDFQSPSAVDTNRWNEIMQTNVIDPVNKLMTNPDALKTAAGRAQVQKIINGMPYGEMNKLMLSRDLMLQRQKLEQQLSLAGKYNPLWHGMDYTNYSTANTGIFNDMNLIPYMSEVDLVKPYLDNLKDSYLYSSGMYDYTGVSEETTDTILDLNVSAIYNTPQAQMHIKALMNLGMSEQDAKTAFTNSIYRAGREFARVNRTANPYSYELAKNASKQRETSGATIGWNDILSKQYSNKLQKAVKSRINTDQSFSDKYNTMLATETDPNKVMEIQILAVDEALGRNVADAFRKELNIGDSSVNPFSKMELKGDEGDKHYTDSRISKMWEKGLNAMYEKVTPGALRSAKTLLFGDVDNTVEYGAHNSKGYLADGINMMSPKQYISLNNRYINELAQEAGFDFNTYRDRDTWGKSNLDIEELVASKQIGNVVVKEIKGFIDSNSPNGDLNRDYVVRVAVPISELEEHYDRGWVFFENVKSTLKEYGFTIEKGTTEGIGSEGYVSFDMVVPSVNNEIDITTSNREFEKQSGTATTQKEIVNSDNNIMQILGGIRPGEAWLK